MYSIYQIAKWFLSKKSDMSSKKLQKLCWYAYSWYIALNSEPKDSELEKLIDVPGAEAWVHGPVFRDLYTDFRYNDYAKTKKSSIENLDGETLNFLERIWNVYGSFSGEQLEEMTHNETPWMNARIGLNKFESSNNLINDMDIFEEYLSR